MSNTRQHRRVWYLADGEVRQYKVAFSAKQLIRTAVASPIVKRGRYFATYHGQFVVRDAEDEGRPVIHLATKDAMIAYLTLLGGNT